MSSRDPELRNFAEIDLRWQKLLALLALPVLAKLILLFGLPALAAFEFG